MVATDGDDNFLPWDPRLDQARVLLKMCVLTNKCLYACTFASHMLVYMYACRTRGVGFAFIIVFVMVAHTRLGSQFHLSLDL